MKTIKLTETLGHIVAVFPGAGDYFIEHHIDFCCGGDRTLEAALQEQSLADEPLLSELNQLYEAFQKASIQWEDWANSQPQKLIDHILVAHHQFLREELPAISGLLFKLLSVHGQHHPELFEVHRVYNLLRTDLEAHLVKEEQRLFPEMAAVLADPSAEALSTLTNTIDTIEAEHVGAGDLIKTLRALTDHYSVPEDGCTTYKFTYNRLQALEKNTFEHIHLENNILIQQFQTL